MRAVVFIIILAAAHAVDAQRFMENEPLETVGAVKQIPVVGSQFQTNGRVPTSMQCVVSLTIQFMFIYTAKCRIFAIPVLKSKLFGTIIFGCGFFGGD